MDMQIIFSLLIMYTAALVHVLSKDPTLRLQECTNCKVFKTCKPEIEKWEHITKDDCYAKIKVEMVQLVEYQVMEQRCKAYNCTLIRRDDRFSSLMETSRSDCLRYEVTRERNHVGLCPSLGVYAFIPNEHVCLQQCLHLSGCLGSTYRKSNQMCSLHSCNDSVYNITSKGDQMFAGITCEDLYQTSRRPEFSLISLATLESAAKHNLTTQSALKFITHTPVTYNTSQFKTQLATSLLQVRTSPAEITPTIIYSVPDATTPLHYTLTLLKLSTLVTQYSQSMPQNSSALTTGLPQGQFFTSYSRFMASNSFASVQTEATQSLVTTSLPLVSLLSLQAKTTSTGVDDASSFPPMAFTLYTKSMTVEPGSTENMPYYYTLTPFEESITTASESSYHFEYFDTTVLHSNEIHARNVGNFFSDPINRLAIPISASVAFFVTVLIFVYCVARKKWKISNISQTL